MNPPTGFKAAEAFWRTLYGEVPDGARLSLWRAHNKASFHAANVAAAAAAVHHNQGPDYYGVGLRVDLPNLDTAHRGSAADVGWVPGFWIDIDIAGPAHKSKDPLPPSLADAVDLLGALPHTPTVLAHSGYGLHAYYLFPELLDIRDTDGGLLRRRATALIETAQRRVIGAGVGKGWHVDSTYDLARVLRVPGTQNRKRHVETCVVTQTVEEKHPVTGVVSAMTRTVVRSVCQCPVVEVLDEGGERVSLGQWEVDLGLDPTAMPAVPRNPGPPSGYAPPAGRVHPPLPLAVVRQKLERFQNPTMAAMGRRLLNGESIADSERDAAMHALAQAITILAPWNPVGTTHADDLTNLWRASLERWASEPGATLSLAGELAKVADKMSRGQEHGRALALQEEAERDELARRWAAKAPTPGPVTTSTPTPEPDPVAGADIDSVLADTPYDAAEIDAIRAAIGVTTDEALAKRWIVQRDSRYHVLTHIGATLAPAHYSSPFGRENLLRVLRVYLSRAPVEWFTHGAKGQPRVKTLDELLMDYSTPAERTEARLDIQHSYLDAATASFIMAACPLRPITPRAHQDVDDWLRALGGADADRLLDWIASATHLGDLTCALYLSGPPGTGKSLLAAGLARLWTKGGCTELNRILENFNADLLRCPLILADEGLPGQRGKQTSVELRTLIGTKKRTLSQKFQPNADLHGCPRLILTANNERLLAFNEDLEPDDIAAMAERFLHIDTGAAVGHLSALGGAQVVHTWVEQDRIAEHALWLRDNRVVVPGERFYVTGTKTRVVESIATRGTLQGLVTEWLVRELVSPSKAIVAQPMAVGGGRMLINTSVVATYWDQHIRSERAVPDTARIGRVLKGLSTGRQVRIKRPNGEMVRVHEILPATLCNWAQENQVGEPETILARLNAPVDTDKASAPMGPAPSPQGQVIALEQRLRALCNPSDTGNGGEP